MLRLLHTADVHLGARHTDLGERASLQRERQFSAFRKTVDVAIAEGVDLVLIAGDLFDSNTQPRRTVERVAAELGRLARASIRTAIIPGTHDVYDGASIYRAYDLAALARAGGDWIAVLTPEHPEVVFAPLDAVVYGRVFDTKRAPRSPLAGLDASADDRATWRIGMVHGALAMPGRTDRDEVVFSADEIAATNLDYLALGHWHSSLRGQAGNVIYAYPGSPEPVAIDQDGAGSVLLVTLDDAGGTRRVAVESRQVGQTRCESMDFDVSSVNSQPDLIDRLARHADPNLILDVRLTGLFPDDLDIDVEEIERDLSTSFLRLRVRDLSIPGLSDEPAPPADTVLGAFIRIVEARMAALESPEDGSNGTIHGLPAAEAGPADEPVADEPAAAEPVEPDAQPAAVADEASAPEPSPTNGTRPEAVFWPEIAGDEAEHRPAVGSFDEAETLAVAEAITDAEGPEPASAEPAVADDVALEPAVAEATPPEMQAAEPAEAEATPAQDGPPEDAAAESADLRAAAAAAKRQQDVADELADLREVLRLGRHLLEGRQVTL